MAEVDLEMLSERRVELIRERAVLVERRSALNIEIERLGNEIRATLEAEDNAQGELTPRQVEIVRLRALGLTVAEVAVRLNLSPETIKTHQKHILMRIDAHTMLEAVAMAKDHGWI